MSSAEISAVFGHPMSAGERISAATGQMAGRLADLLDRALPGSEAAGSRGFLRTMAGAAAAPFAPWGARTEMHPLDRLCRGFHLTPLELDLIILAGLAEEHEGYSGILRTLHPSSEPRATAGLAAQLCCESADDRRTLRAALCAGSAVRNGIIRLDPDEPLFERSLLLGDSLWPVLHEVDLWPAAVRANRSIPSDAGLRSWLKTPPVTRAAAALRGGEARTILVTAPAEDVAMQRGAVLVFTAGAEPVQVVLPSDPSPQLERLVSMHAVARGLVPVIRVEVGAGPGSAEAPMFVSHPGPLVLCGRSGAIVARGPRPVVEVTAERLGPTARQELWQEAVPELAGDAPSLAARYTVEPDTALAAAEDARALARLEGRPLRTDDVAQGVRTRAGLALSSGVRLIRPTATWDQLVLPAKRMAQLREALDRLAHQARVLDGWGFMAGRPGARGVRMLFTGSSGTGKTFAAEVLASTLGVDLLLVDISRVVSKWIGETEKNLAEVFDVAERAQAVLLFDEADALFGKRTEVSDAHDRYANLETAFLLTRLERFEGLAILSTNLRQNIDGAFMRRLEFVLEFEEPGPAERAALWRGHLPPRAPIAEGVDLTELAALYAVVGGFIRNAAVGAGFYAAADDSPITREHLVRAIRREYEKSGRAFPGCPAGMTAP